MTPSASPPRPPSLSPVQHLLVRYAKHGRMRFASQRDVARAVERGIRRAGLPVAHSNGYTPHPKVSYAAGTPTGVASYAEYVTVGLTAAQDPGDVRRRLDAALPDGIDVIDVTECDGGTLNARLTASQWRVELPGVTRADLDAAVRGFLATEHAPVDRTRGTQMRRVDARAAVVAMELDPPVSPTYPYPCGGLRMVVRHTEPAVRPEDVLTALRRVTGLEPTSPPVVTRLAQGTVTADGFVAYRPAAAATVQETSP